MTPKPFWSKQDEEKRLCLEWLKEPLINPQTGYPIERNGPTFKLCQKKCKLYGLEHKPKPTGELTWRKYQEWKQNKGVNPETGRKIKVDGPTFKKIVKKIKTQPPEKTVKLEGTYFLPDTKGYVPCVRYLDSWYILRKWDSRKVWGPLNKPAKDVKIVYYKSTWDYHNNHYKPVFIGGSPPKPPVVNSRVQKIVQPKQSDPKKLIDKIFNLN